MPWFQITDFQRVKMEWLIEAGDEDDARRRFLDSDNGLVIITQSVEGSDGLTVEAWDGPAPSPDLAGHVTDAAADLLASLRAILPYAESRAEDMDETADDALASGRDDADETRAAANKAICAVDAAKALLASLDGSTDPEGAANG